MLRLFLSLYLVLAAALAIFIVGIFVLPDKLLTGSVLRHFERVAEGPQYLIKEELADTPVDAWPEKIEELGRHHGYALDLLQIDDIDLSPENMQKLRLGKPVVSEHDDTEYMLLPLGKRDLIVRIAIEQSKEDHAERLMGGLFYMLEKRLAKAPENEWVSLVEDFGVKFYFPIFLQNLDSTGLDEAETERLRQGAILGFDIDEHNERYLKRVENTSKVLQIGPIPDALIQQIFDYVVFACLAFTVALAAFFWLRSLWRDMGMLDRSTVAFGRGELDTRLDVSKRSPVAGLAGTFNGMAERIQHLIGSHKELTNAVSHELRTPIARMRFAIDMLEDTKSDADRQRYMDNMRADIDELDSLVNELLGYARLDREKPDLELAEMRLSLWLHDLADQARRDAPAIDIALEVPADDEEVNVSFEPKLMSRAVSNVLRNAGRHAENCIRISYAAGQNGVEICIDDDGPGIPIGDRDKIFEPFTRLDTSRARMTGGHGLGLAIVKRIMEWHRGEVFVGDSALGGARFCLRWPLKSGDPGY